MAYALFLCVILLVCQINMMPLDSVEKASDMSMLPLDSDTVEVTTGIAMRVFQTTEKAENVNKMPTDLPEHVLEFSKVSLSRVKILKGTGCPERHAKMWKGGSCVTCEVYMDHMNTDECPGDSSR